MELFTHQNHLETRFHTYRCTFSFDAINPTLTLLGIYRVAAPLFRNRATYTRVARSLHVHARGHRGDGWNCAH